MGQKPKRRSRGHRRYMRGTIEVEQALGALAANTGIKKAFDGVVTEKAWVSSVKSTYFLNDYTATAEAGPVSVYLAHSDYSLAEVESYIESIGSTSWDEGDLVTKEIAARGRRIKMVGQFLPLSGHLPADTIGLNGGRPITTKLNFMLTTGKTVAVIFYNAGNAVLITSSNAQMLGHANLWPQ